MSQENVRVLREMYGRRTVAEAAELMHPAAEMRQPSALPDTDEYYGREALVRGTRRALEAFKEFRFAPEEVVDLGERAFMRVRLSGRGRTSGIEVEQTVFHLWTFRDGMPWRCEVFMDEDAAQQAAGLEEYRMSQENVEIVRRFYEAGQRSFDAYWENPRSGAAALDAGDLDPETEAVLAFLHPEVEYNAVPSALEGGTARGHRGWLTSWDAFLGACEAFSSTINELTDLGGGEVFAAGQITAKWKGSGMTLTEPRFLVLTLRDGLIVRVNAYRDRADALEAAGLRE